ncbi:response regulator [Tateyamaria sp. SN6-1]|uniref:response regulator n=1 Tax=Tateyamaria sp. SN6-1 TaxID=3092148 RepID=UPI0039F47350
MTYHHKVLLIEDDAFTRFMMHEIISGLGVEVESASNGEEGFRTLSDRPGEFGLVLMDLHMPIMSGLDATLKIRNEISDPPRRVPIIAVTADVTYHDDKRVEKLGMNGYASKPVSPGKLMSLIDQYCPAA